MQFNQFFSTDSAKAIKATKYGYLNAINYMAPSTSGGVGNLCPHASVGCIALCLGWHSGQAGMVKASEQDTAINSVRASRIAKAQLFMSDRKAFMVELVAGLERALRKAERLGLKLCARLDGSTGIAVGWLKIKCVRDGVEYPNVFEAFSEVRFVDYTKSPALALMGARGQLPNNWHVTFSRSESNEAQCRTVLNAGGNVAVVFGSEMPETYLGHRVIDGDKHDLRFMDDHNVIIGLSPKGNRAKRDTSGFVVR